MSEPAPRSALLQQALAAARSGDAVEALRHLLDAWRAGPAQPIADAVDEAGRVAARGRWPAESEQRKGAHAQWMELAARRNPADLSLLLETLWHEGKLAQLRKRCVALVRFIPDPRLMPALLGALVEPPCGATGANVEFFWDDLFEVLKMNDDPRLPALAKALVERSKPTEAVRPVRLRAANLVPSSRLIPLEAGEEALCGEVAAAFRASRGQKTEREFLEQIWRRPDDDGVRQVYADWLGERGDPRGEFITLQYARLAGPLAPAQRRREAELVALHRAKWLGALATRVQLETARFERGFAFEVFAGATDASPEWSTIGVLHHAVPADGTPVASLRRLLDVQDLAPLAQRQEPLPIEELHWCGGSGERMRVQLLEQIARLPAMPRLRRLDLTRSFGGADAKFFDWLWGSRLGAGLEELALSTTPTRLDEWLAMMDAHALTRLELALQSVGRVAIVGGEPVRELVFFRPGARGGLSKAVGESFTRNVGAILKLVTPGTISAVQVDLGRPRFSPKIEALLREGLSGRGLKRATVLLENKAKRELL